jgi:hypothetical protein
MRRNAELKCGNHRISGRMFYRFISQPLKPSSKNVKDESRRLKVNTASEVGNAMRRNAEFGSIW